MHGVFVQSDETQGHGSQQGKLGCLSLPGELRPNQGAQDGFSICLFAMPGQGYGALRQTHRIPFYKYLGPPFVFISSLASLAAPPTIDDFSIDVLAENLFNPMEMDIASDGKVFIAELMGKVKVFDPASGETKLIAELDVMYRGKEEGQPIWDKEFGLMGLALAPDFATSKWVYLTYSKPSDDLYALLHYVSRFKFDGTALDLASEQVMLKIPARRDNNRLHEAGSLDFDRDGNLYVSTGDNQWRTHYLYAARTSSNSAALNGKILRIHPEPDGSYTIPEGNLFKPGTPKTLPEIYVMELRNPFRIHVDQKTGFIYWGGKRSAAEFQRGHAGGSR